MNNILSQTAQRRLRAEHLKIKTDGMECGFYACPRASHYNIWDVFIRGSENSLYEGTVMHAQLIFPPEYPIYPPQMYFLQKMFHPNVYPDGKVCISILHVAEDDPTSYEKADEKWTPVQGIRTIILSVISLLNEPNCNSPANVDASKLFNENIPDFAFYVEHWGNQNETKLFSNWNIFFLYETFFYQNETIIFSNGTK
ncbi:Ubiquitin-conjugating enzyme E2 G2 [Gurleya vavrai]